MSSWDHCWKLSTLQTSDTACRIQTCTEPDFKVFCFKLCHNDNDYTKYHLHLGFKMFKMAVFVSAFEKIFESVVFFNFSNLLSSNGILW